ncbi:hypothetical protein P280DRAFT_387058, partial [Massarina eburnea CBS 473.64]
IAESPHAIPNYDGPGNWMPSDRQGANVRIAGGVGGATWYCDRQKIRPVPGLPHGCQFYNACSLYYSAGRGILTLPLDITTKMNNDWHSWKSLTFDHYTSDYSSYLTGAGQQSMLRIQRHDQTWPALLLPNTYHAETFTNAPQYGGLKGELPILLGLYALSTLRDLLPIALPTFFGGGAWQRGVVVHVWTCPPNWAGGSTPHDLETYESGAWGKYFN